MKVLTCLKTLRIADLWLNAPTLDDAGPTMATIASPDRSDGIPSADLRSYTGHGIHPDADMIYVQDSSILGQKCFIVHKGRSGS